MLGAVCVRKKGIFDEAVQTPASCIIQGGVGGWGGALKTCTCRLEPSRVCTTIKQLLLIIIIRVIRITLLCI